MPLRPRYYIQQTALATHIVGALLAHGSGMAPGRHVLAVGLVERREKEHRVRRNST